MCRAAAYLHDGLDQLLPPGVLVFELCLGAGVEGLPLSAPRPVHEVAMLCCQAQAHLHAATAQQLLQALSRSQSEAKRWEPVSRARQSVPPGQCKNYLCSAARPRPTCMLKEFNACCIGTLRLCAGQPV